jgi:hypothetical protein
MKRETEFFFCSLIISLLFIPAFTLAATPVSHPALLFHDISETPGYQNRTEQPYKGYESQSIGAGNNVLKMNFSGDLAGGYNRVSYRGDFAMKTAFAYQITTDPRYAAKAKEALENLDVGTVTFPTDKALALGSYSLAYDWIQPTLDPASDSEIRDKLALMADSVFQSLNDNGQKPAYIDFPDFQGQAYPMMGIAAAALSDYTNPNHVALSSTPDDWLKVATEYLFVDDELHTFNQSLLNANFDSAGVDSGGSYKSYIIQPFAWWLQVYNHFYHVNPFEKFPKSDLVFTSEVWESFPNGYGNDRVTNGNVKWDYHKLFLNLLNDTEKSWVLNYDDQVEAVNILPYAATRELDIPQILYCVYQNNDKVQRTFPPWTSHLDPSSIYQVFRGSWNEDSDWLSLITYNFSSNFFSDSNRDLAHHDQASFEYYSRGDLLLADAGEDKHIPDPQYGHYDTDHNTIAIENPRIPFDIATWSDSRARGAYKGDSHNGVVTPVTIESYLQVPWIQFMYLNETITTVIGQNFLTTQTLSSPIQYQRAVLYPDNYFIIVDRFEGSEPWIYDNIFRPTSQNIAPTTMDGRTISMENIGHVNGNLTIGSQNFDWMNLMFKNETDTGITADRIIWNTVNPYGKNVELQLVSVPDSDIKVTKLIGRIAGYDYQSEVYSPDVWFSPPSAQDLYRVTVLLSCYPEEEQETAKKISVKGVGNALGIQSSQYNDIVYSGSGKSEFGDFATDAEVLFIRQSQNATEFTMLGGSYLNYRDTAWVTMNERADYVTTRRSNDNIVDYKIQGDGELKGDIFGSQIDIKKIEVNAHSLSGTASVSNQNPSQSPTEVSTTNPAAGFDPVSFLKNLAGSIIAFFR